MAFLAGAPASRRSRQRGGGKSWLPTREWWAALIAALTAVLVLWLQQGPFTTEVQIALGGALSQALISYLVPNAGTPGGVPLRTN